MGEKKITHSKGVDSIRICVFFPAAIRYSRWKFCDSPIIHIHNLVCEMHVRTYTQ